MAWSSEPKGQSALRYSSHPRRYASRPARRSPGGRSLIEWPSESESWPEPNGRKESLRDIRYGSLQQVLRGWNVGSPSACDSHACGGDRRGAFGPAKTVPTVPFSLRQFPGNGGIPLGQIPVRLLKPGDRSVFGDGPRIQGALHPPHVHAHGFIPSGLQFPFIRTWHTNEMTPVWEASVGGDRVPC